MTIERAHDTEQLEGDQEVRVRLRILPDMMPAPRGWVRWFDGSLYKKGWKDEDVAHLPTCSDRCYVTRYLTPSGDPDILNAILLHDPVTHEERARWDMRDQIEQERQEILALAERERQAIQDERRAEEERKAEEERNKKPYLISTSTFSVDFDRMYVTLHGDHLRLTPLEYQIMAMLTEKYKQVVSSDELVEKLWGEETLRLPSKSTKREGPGYSNLRTVVSRLRQKLDPAPDRYIRTTMAAGYILNDRDEQAHREYHV